MLKIYCLYIFSYIFCNNNFTELISLKVFILKSIIFNDESEAFTNAFLTFLDIHPIL